MPKPYYQQKPVPKVKEINRQCIWENCMHVRCKKKAAGYFFCKKHLVLATKIDACSFNSVVVR